MSPTCQHPWTFWTHRTIHPVPIRYSGASETNRRFSSKALLHQLGGPSAQRGSSLALLTHFWRFLAFALPLNFFSHFLTAAAR